MQFNEVNGWLALALTRMGARVKWASSDRSCQKTDDISIAEAVAIQSEGRVEPYIIKQNEKDEHPITSYWTSVIRSLIWKEQDGSVHYPDFIIDPEGIAQMVINIAFQFEYESFQAPIRPQFQKEVSLGIKDLITLLRKMKIPKMWQDLAKHVKACFVESNLALQRSYENTANERQKLRIIDAMNSDCV